MDMDKRVRKTIITGIMLLLFAAMAFHAPTAEAKKKNPSLSKKSVSLKKGKKVRISIKNASPKQTKWTVSKKGKSIITLVSKRKKTVTIKGKKAGSASVTAKITLKGKKRKTLRVKVKVSGKTVTKDPDLGKTDGEGEKTQIIAFPGNIKASLTDAGYVKLQWTWVTDAEFYVLQRRTGTGNWEELKNTAAVACTDRTVAENTQYQYRVKAEYKGMKSSAFSSPVTIRTGQVGDNSSVTTEPDPTPAPTPEPGSIEEPEIEAKYQYEIEILNDKKYTLYNKMNILLHIKTNNPNVGSFRIDCGSGKYVYHEEGYYTYEDEFFSVTPIGGYSDIHYKQKSDNRVEDGFVEAYTWQTSGLKNLVVQEKVGNKWVNTGTQYALNLKDYDIALSEWIKNVIKKEANDGMTAYEKIYCLSNYLIRTFKYPSIINDQDKMATLTTECCGCFWDTKIMDCVVATNTVGLFADELGLDWEVESYNGGYFEAENCGGSYAGASHVNNKIYIEGIGYIFDGCPNANNSMIPDNSWNYIL